MMNWKGLGRKLSQPNRGIILAFVLREWGKPQQCQPSVSNTYMHTCNLSLREMPLHQSAQSSWLLRKWQFVKAHTICQTEIPTSLDIWVTNHLLSKCCVHKIFFFFIFLSKHNTCKCWSVNEPSSFYVFCKTVYWCVTTNCYFMSFMMP
jgi:hypothetical protein